MTENKEDRNVQSRSVTAVLPWQTSTVWAVCLIAVYAILACTPLVVALIVRTRSGGAFLSELGLGAALLGFSILCLQVILAGRFHWADRPFGLDMVMKFHVAMAMLAGLLLLCHPILLALGLKSWYLLGFDTSWQVWLGKTAFFLLLLGIGYAVLVHANKLQYQTWRRIHKAMIAIIVLGFMHSLLIGIDLKEPALVAYWWALFTVAVLVFVWRNVVVAIWVRRRFRVADVRPASHDTYTVTLEPADAKGIIPRNPGQFMFLRLIRPGRTSEEHPFTISASPTESGHLAATIKQSGDFTNTIGQTRPDDRARIEYPYGRFSYVHHNPGAFVFIAGGVGITPIRSMLRCLADSGDRRKTVLIYANKTEKDILFRDELENLGENVSVTHVLSKPGENWNGETGYVTEDILKNYAGAILEQADVYLCGPPPMTVKVEKTLLEMGVNQHRIHYERFSL